MSRNKSKPSKPPKKYNSVTAHQSFTIRALHQVSKWPVVKILREKKSLLRGIPVPTVYRHAKISLDQAPTDKRINNKLSGRPLLMNDRQKRTVMKQIKRFRDLDIDFTADELFTELDSEIPEMDMTTFRRYLKRWGFGYLTNRRKGILSSEDKKTRLRYAKELKRKFGTSQDQLDYWKSIMYIDVVGFQYKRNPYELATTPKARSWRRKNESLAVTRKGSKEGVETAKYLVGITYDKGVTCINEVPGNMKGAYFAQMIYVNTLRPGLTEHKRVLQDNDKVQNSIIAKKKFKLRNITLEKIPPRSPDVNIIENLFHQVKRVLNKQAKTTSKTRESKQEFQARCEDTLRNHSTVMINNLINSLPKRIDAIIKGKGTRLKY